MKKIRIPDTELEISPMGMGCENAGSSSVWAQECRKFERSNGNI